MNDFFKNKYFITGLVIIVAAVFVGGSYYLGYREGMKKPQTLIIRGVANLDEGNLEAVDFSLFWEAWQKLKNKYVEADELENQDLVYGAISGLFGALNDPNSEFFPPSDAQKFSQDISGEFSGIGAQIDVRNDQLLIVAPLKGTPADRAGLKPLDKILEVDGSSTSGLIVEEAVKIIRGERGSTVVLTILRDGWDTPREIPIVRDTIQIPTIDWEMKPIRLSSGEETDVVYVHLYNFYEKAPFLFYQEAVDFGFKNPKGIIFDLRSNPGGYLDAAVNLAGWFLKPGEIVITEEFGSGEKQVFTSYGNGFFKEMPMVVLINEGSASASEIVAGALRDNRGIKLVGKKSFGKGTVQEIEPLKDGSLAKFTVAHWLLPKGQLIEKNGLDPDYEVDITEEDFEAGRDPQLEKALEVLEAEISK